MTRRGPAPAHESMADVVRAHAPMAAVGTVAFVVFETMAAARGDASAISYAIIMGVLFVVVATADRWVGFTTPLLWCLVALATLHMAGGLVATGHERVLLTSRWAFRAFTSTVSCTRSGSAPRPLRAGRRFGAIRRGRFPQPAW